MKDIIPPIDKELLIQELTPARFIRDTNKGGNQIYSFTYHEAPNLMLEVGRLREISYRKAGGGSGAILDIDFFDTMKIPYRQLIVWNPEFQEIIGGYRYLICNQKANDNQGKLSFAMTSCFRYSQRFKNKYLPFSIELGRAFIRPEYQASKIGRKSLFALDNLWDGLGALIVNHPKVRYFFGKVTNYRQFNPKARDLLLHFLDIYHPDQENLMEPINPINISLSNDIQGLFKGNHYEEDFQILNKTLLELGTHIPVMMSAYLSLSATMKVLGSTVNKSFGDVDETAIIVTIKDIYPQKIKRHIETYTPRYQNADVNIEIPTYSQASGLFY